MQLHQPDFQTAITDIGAHIVVVSFAEPADFASWVPWYRTTLLEPRLAESAVTAKAAIDPLLARTRFVTDPGLRAYHAYGMGRNSALRVYGPAILWQYVRWGFTGRRIRRPREDVLQKGGDFVIDARRRIALAHVGRDQSDRPAPAAILDALRRGR